MTETPDGKLAIFLQLLIKVRSLPAREATCLLASLYKHAGEDPPSLDAFVALCNGRLTDSGMQVVMGFDGSGSSLTLRSTAFLDLWPGSGESLHKAVSKRSLLSAQDAACTAGGAVSLVEFTKLCANHRVLSAPRLLRCLLEHRWIAAEKQDSSSDFRIARQLTLGPCFFSEFLPQLDGVLTTPKCAICKQPALVNVEQCSSCNAECHCSCVLHALSVPRPNTPELPPRV
ncbi:hypothetical protein cyc_07981 [Cyclospora cayetanensis]|uniref:Uncharacterized protein n=1 Tax=Cyclospora cayetanensis TaxID=88456 RepID=A0A1D3D7K6_9EIME|nr:hypothetical protein cyc_07981 [Cyclospora cayetanensis]